MFMYNPYKIQYTNEQSLGRKGVETACTYFASCARRDKNGGLVH